MNRKKIAEKLRSLRGARSREEVALACGVTAQAISMYENAARIPNDEVKIKIANYYNETVQAIFYSDSVNVM